MKCAALGLLVFLITILMSCNESGTSSKANSTSIAIKNDMAKESIFKLIRQKKEDFQSLSDSIKVKFDFSRRFSQKEISALNLDTTKIGLNEYYFLTDQKFLEKSIDSILFSIFYRHKYGDQVEKLLRVKRNDTVFDFTLSVVGGDGQDTYSTSTEFINDSIFIRTLRREQNVKDNTHLMAYSIDSIVTSYIYNPKLDLQELKKDSFNIYKEFPKFHKNLKGKLFKVWSHPFEINDLTCKWEYEVKYTDNTNSNSKKVLVDLLSQKLIDNKTKKILLNLDLNQFMFIYSPINIGKLDNCKYTSRSKYRRAPYSYTNDSTDINRDGHNDYNFFTESAGGGANESYITYLFNPQLKTFEFSTIFSGTNIEFDSVKNRITGWGKSGVSHYSYRFINLKSNRKDVAFIEIALHYGDSLFYKKLIDDEVLEEKRIVLGEFENFHDYLERK